MSMISLTVQDPKQSRHAVVDEHLAHAMIASVSADPETLSEWQAALTRFIHPQIASELLSHWSLGPGWQKAQDPICVIDLAGRMVVSSWEHELDEGVAATPYVSVQGPSERWYAYHLSDEWLLTSDLQYWSTLSQQRREQRLRQPRIDLRQILYGDPLLEFLVDESLAVVTPDPTCLPFDCIEEALHGACPLDNAAYRAAREIHARWLTSPQPTLQGHSVRDQMLSQRVHIATISSIGPISGLSKGTVHQPCASRMRPTVGAVWEHMRLSFTMTWCGICSTTACCSSCRLLRRKGTRPCSGCSSCATHGSASRNRNSPGMHHPVR